jgi:hypothetical protein
VGNVILSFLSLQGLLKFCAWFRNENLLSGFLSSCEVILMWMVV